MASKKTPAIFDIPIALALPIWLVVFALAMFLIYVAVSQSDTVVWKSLMWAFAIGLLTSNAFYISRWGFYAGARSMHVANE